MWLLSSAGGGFRRAAVVAARAALCALWLCGPAPASGAQGEVAAPSLREKDVRRAARVLAKLRLLEEAADGGRPAVAGFGSLAREFYPGLFVAVADMRASDLKTDLDTAVFLYEEAWRRWEAAGAEQADCAGERPDAYRPLCLGLHGGTVRQMLLAKARLHTSWADAAVRAYRGEADAEATRALSAMRAAREGDLVIAARVVGELKSLGGDIEALASYAVDQERGARSGISPAGPKVESSEALARAGTLLGWMARGPAFYALRSARQSYRDALFWHSKWQRTKAMTISAEGAWAAPHGGPERDPEQVGRAVFANWRAAAKYTRLAEESLAAVAR